MKFGNHPLAVTALAAALLAGLACRLPFIPQPPPATPTPPALPSSIPPTTPPGLSGPLPTSTPLPGMPTLTPSSEFIPHYPSGTTPQITEIKAFTPTDGWGIGRYFGDSGGHDHILTTSDGGETWEDVTPPEANTDDLKRAMAFFLDAATAWVTYAYQAQFIIPEGPVVWHTIDGGRSWTALGRLDTAGTAEFFYPGLMTFSDAENGWLSVSVGAGMSHDYTYFYRTGDGGASWERLHSPSESEYLQGCCKTGMSFGDPQTGLITHGQGPYAEPYVDFTHDGGLTWEHQSLTLPPEPDSSGFPLCDTHSPHAFDGQVSYFAMRCKDIIEGELTQAGSFLYASEDGGRTWRAFSYPGGELHMLNPQQGYAAGEEVYFTGDGGQTWDYRGGRENLVVFDFIDAQYGWAIGREAAAGRLFSTQDGGATWMELFPVIGP